jgi:hypothetical protein
MLLLSVEDRLILSCIKLCPNQDELEQINGLISQVQDWDYFIHTIIDRSIGPLLYKKLPFLTNSSIIPETVKTSLQQVYFKTFSRSTILYEHFQKVAKAFTSHNIPVIALKGIYLSEWLYQDIGLRQFSDIDLLVKEEDGSTCLTILGEFGYKPAEDVRPEFVISKSEFVHYTPMVLAGVSIEIHIKLHRKTEKFDLKLAEIWKNALPVSINNSLVYTLNNNDLFIYLCLHLNKHFYGGHVQFTCFIDITNLIDKYAENIIWNDLIEICRIYNCEDIVFKYIVLVNKYMNATVPADIIQHYSSLLTKKDEQLFSKYLKGFSSLGFSNTVSAHYEDLKQLDTLSDKIRFFMVDIFPSKTFMISKYNIKYTWLVLFYYPYRYWIGVRGVFFRSKR